jgi:hypothetical protein
MRNWDLFNPGSEINIPDPPHILCLENSTESLYDFSMSSFICKECCFSSVAVLQIWIRILILIQLGWWFGTLGTFFKMIFIF